MFIKHMICDFKESKIRYFLILFILTIGIMMVSGNIIAAQSITEQVDKYKRESNVEDGEFTTIFELSDKNIEEIEKIGAIIEKNYFIELEKEKDSILRIFKNRENINTIKVLSGRLAQSENEVLIENKYAEEHHIKSGDTIKIGVKEYVVSGVGIVPDYIVGKRNISDLSSDYQTFGLVFASEEAYQDIMQQSEILQDEIYSYSYTLKNNTKLEDIREALKGIEIPKEYQEVGVKNALFRIVPQENNSRISGYEADVNTTASVCIVIAILLAALFAFIISVFVCHTIERQSVSIGTLYALGIKRSNLVVRYSAMPTAIIFIGGILGEIIGGLLSQRSIEETGIAYSFPKIEPSFTASSILFAVVLPTICGLLIHIGMISHKLNAEPLDLLQKRCKQRKVSKIKIKQTKFLKVYRIRQFLREKAIHIVLFVGVFYSVYILMFGMTINTALNNYHDNSVKDVAWEYMYSLKQMPTKLPKSVDVSYMVNMNTYNEYAKKEMDLSVVGVSEDSKYYHNFIPKGEKGIVVSDCAAKKYNWHKGDTIRLKNGDNGKKYHFIVDKVVPYSASPFVFLPNTEAQKIASVNKNTYNTIFSEHKLNEIEIDQKYIFNVIKKGDIEKAANELKNTMEETVYVVVAAAILIFVAVLYLLLKQIMEKSGGSIGLLKIFGYTEREIRKIFLDTNCITVCLATVLSIVIGKPMIDKMYPYLVTDIPVGLNTSFGTIEYVTIIAIVSVSYVISMILLNRELNRIEYTEILKKSE